MNDQYFEEEEFTTQFNGQTIKRIAEQAKPHWPWVAGFVLLIALVSFQDALFTYLSKLIIDEGILANDMERLIQLFTIYAALTVVQSLAVFGFIPCIGRLIGILAWVWTVAASFTGIRQGLDLDNTKTLVVVLLSFVGALIVNRIIGAIFVLIF